MSTQVHFHKSQQDRIHFNRIRRLVNEELSKMPDPSRLGSKLRALAYPCLYLTLYIASLSWVNSPVVYLGLYVLMGLALVLIFLNLMHDLVHDAIFKSKGTRSLLLHILDLMGANSYIWKTRHMIHHRYQNIYGFDTDIEEKGLLKLYPHDEDKTVHRMQHRYVFLLYPLFLLNWFFVRDFRDFFDRNRVVRQYVDIPGREYVKLWCFKLIFIVYIVVVPIILGAPVVLAIAGLLVMLVVAGMSALTIAVTPHTNSTNEFPVADENGQIAFSWLRHQFQTTNDVTVNKWVSKHLLGSFNHHVTHHIFPRIHSSQIAAATRIVAKYAEQHGLGYRTYSWTQALRLHYQLIRQNAISMDFMEEDM